MGHSACLPLLASLTSIELEGVKDGYCFKAVVLPFGSPNFKVSYWVDDEPCGQEYPLPFDQAYCRAIMFASKGPGHAAEMPGIGL